MDETWKGVIGFEGSYEVSSIGRVRSLTRTVPVQNGYRGTKQKTFKGRMLTGNPDGKGYPRVDLHVDGVRHPRGIHQLVAQAFIPAIDGKTHVNHIDGNPLNNCVTNLEWVTHAENYRHAVASGLMAYGERHGHSKLKKADIPEIRLLIGNVPLLQIAKRFRVSRRAIAAIRDGDTWVDVK